LSSAPAAFAGNRGGGTRCKKPAEVGRPGTVGSRLGRIETLRSHPGASFATVRAEARERRPREAGVQRWSAKTSGGRTSWEEGIGRGFAATRSRLRFRSCLGENPRSRVFLRVHNGMWGRLHREVGRPGAGDQTFEGGIPRAPVRRKTGQGEVGMKTPRG
jgi:hypothetical protein